MTSKRQIVLDTETTGIRVESGHRIVEVAAIEIIDRAVTDRYFQTYVNPERESEPGALAIHGLSREFLADKPKFSAVCEDFLRFITGADLVIHNAAFDVSFLNGELQRVGLQKIETYCPDILDTLVIARRCHPGKRNTLDALCERYSVDVSQRHVHGALVDARLLSQVYLRMTRGQDGLCLSDDHAFSRQSVRTMERSHTTAIIIRATEEEMLHHEQYLDDLEKEIGVPSLWRQVF